MCIVESTQVFRLRRICRPNYTSFEIGLPKTASGNELIVCSMLVLSRLAPGATYNPEPPRSSEDWSSMADDDLEPFDLILIIVEFGIEVDDAYFAGGVATRRKGAKTGG